MHFWQYLSFFATSLIRKTTHCDKSFYLYLLLVYSEDFHLKEFCTDQNTVDTIIYFTVPKLPYMQKNSNSFKHRNDTFLSIRVDGQTTLFVKYLTIFFEIAVNSGRIFTESQSGEVNILPPFTTVEKNNYCFSIYTGSDLNNIFRRKPLKIASQFMSLHPPLCFCLACALFTR